MFYIDQRRIPSFPIGLAKLNQALLLDQSGLG